MFPQDAESVGRVAEQFFPRHEEEMSVKKESESDNREEVGGKKANMNGGEAERDDGRDGDQEMADAKADRRVGQGHAEDVVMQEANNVVQAMEQQSGDTGAQVNAEQVSAAT
jgi:hypothetical protein